MVTLFYTLLCLPAGLTRFIAPLDASALRILYDAANGTTWNNNRGWSSLTTTPCSAVFGVTCDANGFVAGLDLTRNNLRGTIPAALGNCSALEHLYLGGNSLTGTLPSLAGCPLQGLHLFSNALHGSVPAGMFGNDCQLRGLWLHDNRFTGPLPDLGYCSELNNASLWGNSFSGISALLRTQAPQPARVHIYTHTRQNTRAFASARVFERTNVRMHVNARAHTYARARTHASVQVLIHAHAYGAYAHDTRTHANFTSQVPYQTLWAIALE
jgi:hypothetical protein